MQDKSSFFYTKALQWKQQFFEALLSFRIAEDEWQLLNQRKINVDKYPADKYFFWEETIQKVMNTYKDKDKYPVDG